MRPGPSTEVLKGVVAVGARIDVHLGRTVVALDVPCEDVQIDWASDRIVPGKLTYTCPSGWVPDSPAAALNNYGQRSHVLMVLETPTGRDSVDLGWWQHQTWEEDASGKVKVEALDLMQLLEQDPMAWPSSPPSGATVLTEAQRLAGALPVVLDPGTPNPLVSPSTQWGHSRSEAIRDLCVARGLNWAVKADGQLHLWKQTDAREPVARYTGRDLLVEAPRKSVDRRPNRWVSVGSPQQEDDKKPAVRWTGTALNTSWPYEPSMYGWVTDRREFNAASSAAAVRQAANTNMLTALSAASKRSLEIVPDPRLEVGDVIAVHTDADEIIVGKIVAYSLPVDKPGGLMRVDVEELAW